MVQRFLSSLFLALLLTGVLPGGARAQAPTPTQTGAQAGAAGSDYAAEVVPVIDFDSESSTPWYVVNDGVMGGRSSSSIRPAAPGTAVFQGDLSLENNGGFASVRAGLAEGALAGAERIVLRVRGDGKRYQLRLRRGRSFDGLAFAGSFDTVQGEWITVELPIASLQPTFRGYRPRRVEPLDPEDVGQLGLMLTDKQVGEFRLEIDWIGFVPSA